jgi:pimeloyl-ACP methyl ester carboxylesterase
MFMRILFAGLLALLAGGVHAAWERTGQTPSGAVYRFAVPENWRAGDDLVVYQHGLSFEQDLSPQLGPLLDLQLAQGYAVAASGYSQSGWAVFASPRDNRELIERFRTDVGVPGRILTYGASMGGYIALQLAEDPHVDVDGVLALCPAAAGYRSWDAALDLRLVYDAVCDDVEGARLPADSTTPWLVPPGEVTPLGLENIVLRANRCTGVNSPPWQRSEEQQQRLAMLKQSTGIASDDFLLLNLGYATLGLSDLVRDSGKLAGGNALGNARVDYGDDALNASVRRVESDPLAVLDFRLRSGLSGAGRAKVISLHTSADELVVPGHQAWLRDLLPPARLSSALVAETAPSHCGLQAAELMAAWDGLRDWLATDAQPDAVELQARCLALSDAGSAEGECRIDPAREPEHLDAAIRPRNEAGMAVDARVSGHWYDPSRDGEGWMIEVLDSHTALIYGFTYPASGEDGDQSWLLGTGIIDADGIVVDELYGMRGGSFGDQLDSADARFVPWGSARLVFTACGSARMRLRGARGEDRGERALTQLMAPGDFSCQSATAETEGLGALSGSWYDQARPGQGLVMQARNDGSAIVLFFGYGPTGEPVWLYGQGKIDADGRLELASLVRPRGTRFDIFDAMAVERIPWGGMTLDFASCDTVELRYRGDEPGFGEGAISLSRLTRPSGLGDCGLR